MNFTPDTLIALSFLVPVAAFAMAELAASGRRALEKPSRMSAPVVRPIVLVDVSTPAANDDVMREAA